MRNNLIIGILILIALAGNAYAQTAQAASGIPQLSFLGNWQWFAVNALIIFAVLFVVQSVLIQNKPDKEKAVSWALALAIALVISWFVSSSGFVWQHPRLAPLFNLKVLTNTLVISLAVYIGLSLLPKFKMPDSTPGKIGMGILIGLIALMAALKIGDMYVWKVESIKAFVNYLFGPQGILTFHQNRIAVFIASSAVFAWLFAFLGVSKEQPAINYILAVVLGASLASGPNPRSIKTVITFVHLVGTIVLGRNLAEQVSGKWKIAAYAGAFFILWWAINATAPGHGLGGSVGELLFGKEAKPGAAALKQGPGLFIKSILLVTYIFVLIVASRIVNKLLAGTIKTETAESSTEEAQSEESEESAKTSPKDGKEGES